MYFCLLQAITGIAIVIDALNRFAPTDKTLTAIHSDLIQVSFYQWYKLLLLLLLLFF